MGSSFSFPLFLESMIRNNWSSNEIEEFYQDVGDGVPSGNDQQLLLKMAHFEIADLPKQKQTDFP